MDSVYLGVILAILGTVAFIIWIQIQCNIENAKNNSQTSKKAMSGQGKVILILTAIIALILFIAWATGSSHESQEICGACGGSGWFFNNPCKWCHSTGYEEETINSNTWCFWLGVVVLCTGVFYSFKVESNK